MTLWRARLAELRRRPLCSAAGGEFSLFYTNCEKLTVVSFDIKVALYNVRSSGYKDYLSVGEDMLPLVFMVCHSLPDRHVPCLLHSIPLKEAVSRLCRHLS